ncbi:MAG: DivIVA domain-containing protein [Mycoplasmatales bacterium]|nr:DivIVA domain-containing protein [Mycoplasmatales bacterium]
MAKLNLKSELVLNKKFSTELSGYNAKEVDEYLDEILQDYRTFEELVATQKSTLAEKTDLLSDRDEKIEQLELEIETLKSQLIRTEEGTNSNLKKEIEEIKRQMSKMR